jgi:hypothetical protein
VLPGAKVKLASDAPNNSTSELPLMVKLPMPGPAALVFLVLTCRPRLAATPDRTALLPARSAIEEAGGSSIKSNDLLYIIQQTDQFLPRVRHRYPPPRPIQDLHRSAHFDFKSFDYARGAGPG